MNYLFFHSDVNEVIKVFNSLVSIIALLNFCITINELVNT